jgi:hypothetical protein
MQAAESFQRAHQLLALSKYAFHDDVKPTNFREFASLVADVVRHELTAEQRASISWLKDWAPAFRQLSDDFERELWLDPYAFYKPLTAESLRFHLSDAFCRYALCANGTGKTTMGYFELYLASTGRHFGLQKRRTPVDCAVISVGLGGYAETVYERKFLESETGNLLSPIFRENGRWFNSYEPRTYAINIACYDCAYAGRAKQCTHTHSVRCFSEASGFQRFMGATYGHVLIDEPVDKKWFTESCQRVTRGTTRGRVDLTGTAVGGTNQWEYNDLVQLEPARNSIDPGNPQAPKFVDVFSISKKDTGMYSDAEIERHRLEMSDAEFEARVMGRMVAIVDNPVFNYRLLDQMEKVCREPVYGSLQLWMEDRSTHPIKRTPLSVEVLERSSDVHFVDEPVTADPRKWTGLRLWEAPVKDGQYMITADVAMGLSEKTHDPSSATVWKMVPVGGELAIEAVAQYHGWINPRPYGDELKKLGVWYNDAIIVPENNAVGEALMQRLSGDLIYANIFRDNRSPSQMEGRPIDSRAGLNTNMQTKPMMIAAVKHMMGAGTIIIRDKYTLAEMRAFEQTTTSMGNVRYAAGGSMHDDRVMVVGLAAYAVSVQGSMLYTFMSQMPASMLKKDDGGGYEY